MCSASSAAWLRRIASRVRAAEYRRCQRDEFAHQVVTLQREIGRRLSGIRFRLESVAVRLDQHHRLRLTSFSRGDNAHAIAQGHHLGRRDFRIAEGCEVAGILAQQGHRGGRAHAEFPLEAGLGLLNIADAEQRGVHAHLNLVDGLRIEAMLTANELCGVDRRMRQVTRCVVLEEIVADQEFSRESASSTSAFGVKPACVAKKPASVSRIAGFEV